MADIAKLRGLLAKATPGPWSVCNRGCYSLDDNRDEADVDGAHGEIPGAESCRRLPTRTSMPYFGIARPIHFRATRESSDGPFGYAYGAAAEPLLALFDTRTRSLIAQWIGDK